MGVDRLGVGQQGLAVPLHDAERGVDLLGAGRRLVLLALRHVLVRLGQDVADLRFELPTHLVLLGLGLLVGRRLPPRRLAVRDHHVGQIAHREPGRRQLPHVGVDLLFRRQARYQGIDLLTTQFLGEQ